jgi:hypothetical protein
MVVRMMIKNMIHMLKMVFLVIFIYLMLIEKYGKNKILKLIVDKVWLQLVLVIKY